MVRPPVEICMTDKWSCTTCTTLQVLYMFGLEEPPFDLQDIDRRIGRMPGMPCPGDNHMLELVRCGFTLISIREFDTEVILGPNGYEYACRYLAERSPRLLELYTPEYFAEWQGIIAENRRRRAQLPGKVEETTRAPTAQDILSLLSVQACSAVLVPFIVDNGQANHLTIAYGVDPQGKIAFYIPQAPDSAFPLFDTLSLDEVDAILSTIDGITGVSW